MIGQTVLIILFYSFSTVRLVINEHVNKTPILPLGQLELVPSNVFASCRYACSRNYGSQKSLYHWIVLFSQLSLLVSSDPLSSHIYSLRFTTPTKSYIFMYYRASPPTLLRFYLSKFFSMCTRYSLKCPSLWNQKCLRMNCPCNPCRKTLKIRNMIVFPFSV